MLNLRHGEFKEKPNGLGLVMRLSYADKKLRPNWRLKDLSVTDVSKRPEKKLRLEPSKEKRSWKP